MRNFGTWGQRALACHLRPDTPKLVFGAGGKLIPILYAAPGFLLTRREVYEKMQAHLELPVCNTGFGRPMVPYFLPLLKATPRRGPLVPLAQHDTPTRARLRGVSAASSMARLLRRVGSMRMTMGLALALVGCGTNGGSTSPNGGAPGWQPLDSTSLPSSCGASIDPPPASPRPSSLHRGPCDFGETADATKYDLNCAPGTTCSPTSGGDQLCHRICDDGKCAAGETCDKRVVYVSDTPSRSANLCMCAGGACTEKPSATTPEGPLAAWRDEAPMPVELYYHAAAASDRHLFVSGGLNVTERSKNGSSSARTIDAVFVASLDTQGAVSGWRQAGKLAAPILNHAMAIVGDRLYVAGGQNHTTGAPSFTDAVVSYPIAADGSLGAARDEARLPHKRGGHVLLADTGRAGTRAGRLIVASGGVDASFFSDGTTEIAFADVAPDGAVTAWSTADAPAALYYDRGAGLVAGTLYGFVSGDYNDRSTRALYGIRLRDLTSGTPSSAFVQNAAWSFDPAALSAVNEHVRLSGSCGALVLIGEGGATATAPVDAAAHVGSFHATARFFGAVGNEATATSPAGSIYVTGGFGTAAQGVAVRSTRRP